MNQKPFHSPSSFRTWRSPTVILLCILELVCVGLLLSSLRTLAQPNWTAQKVAGLRSEATKQAETSKDTTSADSTTNVVTATTATVDQSASDATNDTSLTQADQSSQAASTQEESAKTPNIAEVEQVLSSIFAQLPTTDTVLAKAEHPVSTELVNLGRILFYDPRLSMNGEISCNSCHKLDGYGVDSLARSKGMGGKAVDRNSPTVYNAALHVAQFWDGRSPTVEDQATKPIMAAGEMGMVDITAVKESLQSIPDYEVLFKAAFPNDRDPISLENIGIAIGAFERGLLTPSRFDYFLAGDRSQLNEQEQRGLAIFVSLRCPTCHMAETIGGQSYKRLGEKEAYPTNDLGRFTITKKEEDKYVFKVPSLRNVAKTAPYLHDGSIASLEEMVRLMARYQLAKEVSDEQVIDIVAFLNSLTGEIPQEYIQPPELPKEVEMADQQDSSTSDQAEGNGVVSDTLASTQVTSDAMTVNQNVSVQAVDENLQVTQDSKEIK